MCPNRPDSSTTVQGDENNNNSSVARLALSTSPKNARRSPTSDFFDSTSVQTKKTNFPTKYNKKRSLFQEVPAKYFSTKKAIMLNFLNGSDQQTKQKIDDENGLDLEGYEKRAAENQIRLKKGSDCENGFKNQYSVLQVRKKKKNLFPQPDYN